MRDFYYCRQTKTCRGYVQPALHILVEAATLEETQKLMIEEGISNDSSCGCVGYSWELLTWNASYDQGPQYIQTKGYEASKDIKLSNRLQYRRNSIHIYASKTWSFG